MTFMIRMEVASSWPDRLPTLSAAKTSKLSLLAKSPFWWRSGRCLQCYTDFMLRCAGDLEAYHTDSGVVIDCAETLHLGDWWVELTTATTSRLLSHSLIHEQVNNISKISLSCQNRFSWRNLLFETGISFAICRISPNCKSGFWWSSLLFKTGISFAIWFKCYAGGGIKLLFLNIIDSCIGR